MSTKERPIMFSGGMVCAILEGRKTQTRRVVKEDVRPEPARIEAYYIDNRIFIPTSNSGKVGIFNPPQIKCPYGKPGDRLWVRETFTFVADGEFALRSGVAYKAEGAIQWLGQDTSELNGKTVYNQDKPDVWKWKSSMFMLRRLSRILLEVVSVRVERVQSITEADAIAEGIEQTRLGFRDYELPAGVMHGVPAEYSYRTLWDSINGKKVGCSWADNPWVWVPEFKVLEVTK
jgi:hypothetical protein